MKDLFIYTYIFLQFCQSNMLHKSWFGNVGQTVCLKKPKRAILKENASKNCAVKKKLGRSLKITLKR